jgi:hypothetical protein
LQVGCNPPLTRGNLAVVELLQLDRLLQGK